MYKIYYYLFIFTFLAIKCFRCSNVTQYNTELFNNSTMQRIAKNFDVLNLSNELLQLRMDELDQRLGKQTTLLRKLYQNIRTRQKREVCNATELDVRSIEAKVKSQKSCSKKKYPNNCKEVAAAKHSNGIYAIQVDSLGNKPFLAVCDEETDGGGWTVIQRRLDGSTDFYRDWQAYKSGFGNLAREFFIGLDRLHALTTTGEVQELMILMDDFDGTHRMAKYDAFAIGDESEAYSLKVLGQYSGDAGDSLIHHANLKFTTKDRDNDNDPKNCAQTYLGAWWYGNCHTSNLNGLYLRGSYTEDKFGQGVVWKTFRDNYYSLKYVQMMIRPKKS